MTMTKAELIAALQADPSPDDTPIFVRGGLDDCYSEPTFVATTVHARECPGGLDITMCGGKTCGLCHSPHRDELFGPVRTVLVC